MPADRKIETTQNCGDSALADEDEDEKKDASREAKSCCTYSRSWVRLVGDVAHARLVDCVEAHT